MDFGDGTLTSVGSYDIFIAKYLGSNGDCGWAKAFGGTDLDVVYDVAVDGSCGIAVTGYFRGSADFGGWPLNSDGLSDIFVLKYNADGDHIWSDRFGGAYEDRGLGITMDDEGNVLVTGIFQDTADFGGSPQGSSGGYDIFLLKLQP